MFFICQIIYVIYPQLSTLHIADYVSQYSYPESYFSWMQ